MQLSLVLFPLIVASLNSSTTVQDEPTEIGAAGGKMAVFTEVDASKGSSIYCEYEVLDLDPSDQWLSLIAISLDEGKMMDRDSKFLQLDMQYLIDEDRTIMHALSNSGFGDDSEEAFLYHWEPSSWYSLYFEWEDDDVFRYQANIGGSVVGAGVYTRSDFDPKYFRVAVSGMKVAIDCEVE